MFSELLDAIQFQIVRLMAQIAFQRPPEAQEISAEELAAREDAAQQAQAADMEKAQFQGGEGELPADAIAGVGRNEPCPCGSGERFKNCHGKLV